MVIPTVGAMGRRGRAAVGDGAEVDFLGAGGVRSSVLRFPVV